MNLLRFFLRPYGKQTCAQDGSSPTVGAGVRAKLCDTRGFALAEQLIGVLFLGLLIVVIGAGLNAAMQAYRTANEATRANELLTRAVQEVSDELAFAPSVQTEGDNPVFVSPTTKTPVTLGNDANGRGITLVEQGAGGSSDSQSESILVASSLDPANNADPQALIVAVSDVTYNGDQNSNIKGGTWTFHIEVKLNGRDEVLAETSLAVARMGK